MGRTGNQRERTKNLEIQEYDVKLNKGICTESQKTKTDSHTV